MPHTSCAILPEQVSLRASHSVRKMRSQLVAGALGAGGTTKKRKRSSGLSRGGSSVFTSAIPLALPIDGAGEGQERRKEPACYAGVGGRGSERKKELEDIGMLGEREDRRRRKQEDARGQARLRQEDHHQQQLQPEGSCRVRGHMRRPVELEMSEVQTPVVLRRRASEGTGYTPPSPTMATTAAAASNSTLLACEGQGRNKRRRLSQARPGTPVTEYFL